MDTGSTDANARPEDLRRRRARHRTVGALVAVVAIGAVAAVVREVSTRPEPPFVLRERPGVAEIVDAVAVERPGPMAVVGDSVWVVTAGTTTFRRFDATTGDVQPQPELGPARNHAVCGISGGGDTVVAVFCDDSDVAPQRAAIVDADAARLRTFAEGGVTARTAIVTDEAVWLAGTTPSGEGRLVRFDPTSGEVLNTTVLDGVVPQVLASGLGSLWLSAVADEGVGTPEGRLLRIDPEDGSVISTTVVVPAGPGQPRPPTPSWVVVDDAAVWVAVRGSNVVVLVDPDTAEVTEEVTVGGSADRVGSPFIAAGADGLWVRPSTRRLLRLDPTTGAITRDLELQAGGDNAPFVIAGEHAWLGDHLTGRVLHVALSR